MRGLVHAFAHENTHTHIHTHTHNYAELVLHAMPSVLSMSAHNRISNMHLSQLHAQLSTWLGMRRTSQHRISASYNTVNREAQLHAMSDPLFMRQDK